MDKPEFALRHLTEVKNTFRNSTRSEEAFEVTMRRHKGSGYVNVSIKEFLIDQTAEMREPKYTPITSLEIDLPAEKLNLLKGMIDTISEE